MLILSRLNVQILYVLCVALNELAARLYLITHQNGEDFVRLCGIARRDLQHDAGLRVHGRLPKLLGVHFTKAFVALNIVAALQLRHDLVALVIGIRVIVALILRDAEQRRLCDVHVSLFDKRAHIAVEERQKQSADVRTVDIGIGHDDDAAVTELIQIEFFADARAERRNDRHELIVAVCSQGCTDMVMNAARAAGARGGTVLHGKGTGAKGAPKFYNITIAQEKEMILIVAATSQKAAIMQSILQKAGPDSKAGTIVFSLPTTQVAGFALLDNQDEA